MASSVAAPTSGVADAGTAKSKWSRVASVGFLLVSAGMAFWLIGGILAGQSLAGEGGMLVIPSVIGVVASAVVTRFGMAGKVAGIVLVLALLMPPTGVFYAAFSLGAPGAFFEFSGATMYVVGILSALGYTIGSIVRRNEVHTEATRGESRAIRVMLGIVVLAIVLSAVMSFTSRSTVDAAAAAGATEVTMSDFEFEPGTFQATAGETTKILVSNSDAFVHDFAIPALGVESGLINPGSQKLIEVTGDAGQYTVYCNLHSDTGEKDPEKAGMAAMLTIE